MPKRPTKKQQKRTAKNHARKAALKRANGNPTQKKKDTNEI